MSIGISADGSSKEEWCRYLLFVLIFYVNRHDVNIVHSNGAGSDVNLFWISGAAT